MCLPVARICDLGGVFRYALRSYWLLDCNASLDSCGCSFLGRNAFYFHILLVHDFMLYTHLLTSLPVLLRFLITSGYHLVKYHWLHLYSGNIFNTAGFMLFLFFSYFLPTKHLFHIFVSVDHRAYLLEFIICLVVFHGLWFRWFVFLFLVFVSGC